MSFLQNKANFGCRGNRWWSKSQRLPRPFGPPKKIEGSYGVRVEIAAVAALLRNDKLGVFLLHTSWESGQVLAMTAWEWPLGTRLKKQSQFVKGQESEYRRQETERCRRGWTAI